MESNQVPKTSSPVHAGKTSPKMINLRSQFEHMLHNAVLMTEMAMDLKERCTSGEKYICYLRSLCIRGGKTINAMQSLTKSFLLLTQKFASNAVTSIENAPMEDHFCSSMKTEYEKLLALIEKELSNIEDVEVTENVSVNLNNIVEKIKHLEVKQNKASDGGHLPPSNSAKSFKSDVDEKYPENWSRESLIDLNNVVNLPSVPEDIFGYTTKPTRTSSLSSLKSMRKVKLYLQRAGSGSDEDDDNSESDDHDSSGKLVVVRVNLHTY